jgi:ABC-type uncharacterized transport system ATPase subunit
MTDPTPSGPLLIMTGMTKQYPGCLANDHVSLTVERNQIHALLGENGAGKSTLVKIIYGVVKPDEGEIIWEGQKSPSRTPAMRSGWASAWCFSTSRCSRR